MTRIDVANRRIAERERELARAQFENVGLQIEGNLARMALHETLTTAAHIARAAREVLSIPIDEHLEEMGLDLVSPKEPG